MTLARSFLGVAAIFVAAVVSNGCSSDSSDDTTTAGPSGSGGSTSTTSSASSMSSSSMTPSTSTTTSTTTSTGSGGLSCMEKYTSVPTGECDLLQQNCPAGSFCNVAKVDGMSTTKCVPDQGGLKDKGDECSTNTECKGGLLCVDKHCSPFCCPETNEPCGGGSCDVNLSFDNDKTIFAMTCSYSVSCDLFAGNCGSGTDCHLSDASACLAVCDAPSDQAVPEGGKCMYRNDCGDSQICNKNQPDDGVCRYFCNTKSMGSAPGKGGCPSGQSCKGIGGTGCTDLGICVPM